MLTFHSGHENMGIVEEIGSGVSLLKKGDRVVMPFNVADGRCANCLNLKTAFCTGVNPGFAGGAYGYVAMGMYSLTFFGSDENPGSDIPKVHTEVVKHNISGFPLLISMR